MEVHHHPHVEKKNFKEYFLEFLMIFLAVTLGFFAENVRENITDNHKEKEYMVSMLSDVEKDTTSYNHTITSNRLLVTGTDTALNYLASNLNNFDTAQMALLYFYKYCINLSFFHLNDGTVTQLRNNGGLRLIRNKDVVNKINVYYRENARLTGQEKSISDFLNSNDKQAGEIFNYMSNKNFIDSAYLTERSTYEVPLADLKQWLKPTGSIMFTTDAKVLSSFLNNVSYNMGVMESYVVMLKAQKQAATELIKSIKENYSLQNE